LPLDVITALPHDEAPNVSFAKAGYTDRQKGIDKAGTDLYCPFDVPGHDNFSYKCIIKKHKEWPTAVFSESLISLTQIIVNIFRSVTT
jgi:hypothetical protein